MPAQRSDPGFLHRPPKLHPLTSFLIGVVCLPLGMELKGSLGGGLVGAGIGAILMGLWDTVRLKAGLVHTPIQIPPEGKKDENTPVS